jgi:hypothetical protein
MTVKQKIIPAIPLDQSIVSAIDSCLWAENCRFGDFWIFRRHPVKKLLNVAELLIQSFVLSSGLCKAGFERSGAFLDYSYEKKD